MSGHNIKIIYENNDLLAVNKPAGLIVHAANAGGDEPTLVDWILKNYPKIKGVGDPSTISGQAIPRPGIVHRLDKDTSGVLIIAKNQEAFEFLKKQFAEREIKKEYLALISGHLKKEWGVIDLPIGKSKKDFRKKTCLPAGRSTHVGKLSGKAREAKTEYRLMERFEKYDLVQVLPKTGRTHQIRVHMRALNHPVAGDKLYGFKDGALPGGLTRHFLHAKSVELELPEPSLPAGRGKIIKIEAELPRDLKSVLEGLRLK